MKKMKGENGCIRYRRKRRRAQTERLHTPDDYVDYARVALLYRALARQSSIRFVARVASLTRA